LYQIWNKTRSRSYFYKISFEFKIQPKFKFNFFFEESRDAVKKYPVSIVEYLMRYQFVPVNLLQDQVCWWHWTYCLFKIAILFQ